MTYSQQIDFLSSTKITLKWPDFKTIVLAKGLFIQFITNVDSYTIFATDANITYVCYLVFSSESPGYPFTSDYPQSQNDADTTDFQVNYMTAANARLSPPRLSDGRQRTSAEKSNSSRVTLYSHDWTDPTTWYTTSGYAVGETVTDSGTYTNYYTAHHPIIDTYHGKITGEDFLLDAGGHKYRVAVYVNGVKKTEQDPHYGTGGDYVVDYHNGLIQFLTANQPTDVVTVDYHYMVDSTFIITPSPGKALIMDSAEVQFSTDVIITDTTVFQPYGYVDYFAPQLVASGQVPSGTKIPIGNHTSYKTMSDFQNDAARAYPVYPALGGSGWRGLNVPLVILDWDYTASTVITSAVGMEIRIKLEHDTPFSGISATATFYCISQNA